MEIRGTVVFDRSDVFTFANVISGSGAVEQSGTGTLMLTGANTYSGGTTVNRGTLAAGAASVLSPNSVHGIAAGAMLDLAGFDQTVKSVSNAGTIETHGAGPGLERDDTGVGRRTAQRKGDIAADSDG